MKRALAGAAVIAAGLTMSLPADAIIGGTPDAGEHPYVGQLLFYVPSAVDSRFDDPGGWFNCTGTLINPTTVVTAGHCTFDVGLDGEDLENAFEGGNDIWFSVEEAPDYSILPPSSTFVPDRNEERYDAWSAALDASDTWYRAEAVYTHPEYVDAQFLVHDLGVFTLSEPIELDEYGALPDAGYLDRYYAKRAKATALFESVGYGLEDSSPKTSAGGDTRRKADRRLVSFKGAYGYRDIAVMFSHAPGGANGGTCFGDSGGPTFDITGSPTAPATSSWPSRRSA